MAEVVELKIEEIEVGDYATRLDMADEALEDLAASIRRLGVVVPIVVCAKGDKFSLIAGHRRVAAAKMANLETVPAIIRKDTEAARREVSLVENLFRCDLSPIEQACAIKDILEVGDMKVPDVAKCMHRSEHWIAAQLAMLAWPPDVISEIHSGMLSVSAASNIAMITDDTYRLFLLNNAHDNGATARTTAAWLQAWRARMPPQEAITQEPVASGAVRTPALPQAPCLVCGMVQRTDGLAMVMICPTCITAIRAGVS